MRDRHDKRKKIWMPYTEAAKWVRRHKISTKPEFHALGLHRPFNLPSEPWRVYAITGEWDSWDAFVDRPPTGRRFRGTEFVSYTKASKWARDHGIASALEWRQAYKAAPMNVPAKPEVVYRDKGWTTWLAFLKLRAAGRRASSKYFMSYSQFKEYIRAHDITTIEQYRKLVLRNDTIPLAPQQYFSKTGEWEGWRHLLNLPPLHVSYEEARAFAIKQGMQKQSDWFNFDPRPAGIPFNPCLFYTRRNQWISWNHFFGRM